MNLRNAFPKTASRKNSVRCAFVSGANRPERRTASRVWVSRRRKRVGVICYADHLGTPRAVTRPSDNAVVWRWDNSDPFGANLPNENPSGLGNFKYNNRFPGQYYDQETGTHYNYFRDYDPATGRYAQSDPIGLQGGINTFGYVGAKPLNARDSRGLWATALIGGTVIRVIGGRAAVAAIGAGARRYGMAGTIAVCVLAGVCTLQEDEKPEPEPEKWDDDCPVPDATEGEKTRGPTRDYDKQGDYDDTLDDFYGLNPKNVKPIPDIPGAFGGTLPNRDKVVARPYSGKNNDGPPTLEIQQSNGPGRVKVRYK